MITDSINRAFEHTKTRGWDRTFWAIDIHDTLVKSNYKSGEIPTEFFPYAKYVMTKLSLRPDIKLILYTCSHPHEIEQYLKFFEENGIHFDYINENPEVKTDMKGYGNYDKKPYFNLLLDDKAGFNAEKDLLSIKSLLNRLDREERLKTKNKANVQESNGDQK